MDKPVDSSAPKGDPDLAEGVRLIRAAVDRAFGSHESQFSTPREGSPASPLDECKAIAATITKAGEQYERALDKLDESTTTGRRTTRKVLIGCLTIVALLATYTVWPLLGLYRLAKAVEARNAALLSELVDFPALRQSVAEQVISSYLKLTGKDARLGQLTRAVVIGTTASVVDPLVGRVINPESLIDLMGKGTVPELTAAPIPAGPAPITSSALNSALTTWLDAEYRFRDFYVQLPPNVAPAQQYRLMLRLTAGKWRLTTIDLPEEIRNQLAREVIKAGG